MGRISPTRQPDLAAPTPKKDGRVTRTLRNAPHWRAFSCPQKLWVMRSRFLGFRLFLDQMVCPVLIMAPPPIL